MARTKSSRGAAPFKLRSGNSPLPFWGGVKKFAKKAFNATPIGMAANALKGGGGGGDAASAQAEAQGLEAQGTVGGLAGNQLPKAAMGGEGSDQKLEAINEILNS